MKFGSLRSVCDDDKFGSSETFEVYILCVMMISLEVWKFTSLHGLHDDDKFKGLEVYSSCVMLISLEVWKFTCCA